MAIFYVDEIFHNGTMGITKEPATIAYNMDILCSLKNITPERMNEASSWVESAGRYICFIAEYYKQQKTMVFCDCKVSHDAYLYLLKQMWDDKSKYRRGCKINCVKV